MTCNKLLAPGQWWNFCGETDMGQSLPAQCTECGGEYELAPPEVQEKYFRKKAERLAEIEANKVSGYYNSDNTVSYTNTGCDNNGNPISNIIYGDKPAFIMVKKGLSWKLYPADENVDYTPTDKIATEENTEESVEEAYEVGTVQTSMTTGKSILHTEEGPVVLQHGDAVLYKPSKRWFDLVCHTGAAKFKSWHSVGEKPVLILAMNKQLFPRKWYAYDPLGLLLHVTAFQRTLECEVHKEYFKLNCSEFANAGGGGEFMIYLFGEAGIPALKQALSNPDSIGSMDVRKDTQTVIVR